MPRKPYFCLSEYIHNLILAPHDVVFLKMYLRRTNMIDVDPHEKLVKITWYSLLLKYGFLGKNLDKSV